MFENDVICSVTLRHLSQFWRVIVHYNVLKEVFPRLKGIVSLGKIPLLSAFNITKNQKCNITLLFRLTVLSSRCIKKFRLFDLLPCKFQLAGIDKPNDGECHLAPHGNKGEYIYTEELTQVGSFNLFLKLSFL